MSSPPAAIAPGIFARRNCSRGRTPAPLIEIHRVAWYGDSRDKRPQLANVESALRPALTIAAARSGLTFKVYLWDDFHGRYLISDLVGINLPNGSDTTTDANCLRRTVREDMQREFDNASSRHTLRLFYALAGDSAKGQALTTPVYHYSLSWAPGETPTRNDMLTAGATASTHE